MSMSLDLPDQNYEMVELTGAWSRERSVKNRKLEHGTTTVFLKNINCWMAHIS